jgi:putative dimethyl sulfoxide reductase chaperone
MAVAGAGERTAGARALGGAWALVAAGLREPDGGEFRAALRTGEFRGAADGIVGELEGWGGGGLHGPWRRLAAAHAGRTREELVEERVRVFGHAVRGPCPPYELEYGTEHFLGKSHRMGDAAAFYRAFGVEVSGSAHERPDHAAVEAEFLSLLCIKRALAEERGEEDRAAVCLDAERLFLDEHLGRFLPALALRVAEREPGGALDAVLSLAAALAGVHAAAVGARLGRPDLELRALGSLEEETVVSCSPCSGPGSAGGDDGGAGGGTEV